MKVVKLLFVLAMFALSMTAGQPTCMDAPVKITMATYAAGAAANYGIWGDGVVKADGGTVYEDAVSGVYAKFQVCNGTSDLILNLLNTRGRTLWWNWGNKVGDCTATDPTVCVASPAWVASPVNVKSFVNVNKVFTLVATQSTTTWMTGKLTVNKTDYAAPFRNPTATLANTDPPVTVNQYVVNNPNPTGLIYVSRRDCATYLVTTGTVATADDPLPGVTTLFIPASQTSPAKNAGQFEMPISMTVELLQKNELDPDPNCR